MGQRVQPTGEHCAFNGCEKPALGDQFCSRKCAEAYYAHDSPHMVERRRKDEKNRRARVKRLREKLGANAVVVANPDAMAYKADGHYGQEGPRRGGRR